MKGKFVDTSILHRAFAGCPGDPAHWGSAPWDNGEETCFPKVGGGGWERDAQEGSYSSGLWKVKVCIKLSMLIEPLKNLVPQAGRGLPTLPAGPHWLLYPSAYRSTAYRLPRAHSGSPGTLRFL